MAPMDCFESVRVPLAFYHVDCEGSSLNMLNEKLFGNRRRNWFYILMNLPLCTLCF